MPNPTVKQIVEAYLKEHGFDGLYVPGTCGCVVRDLAPCCGECWDCIAGYKGPGDPEEGSECTINEKPE